MRILGESSPINSDSSFCLTILRTVGCPFVIHEKRRVTYHVVSNEIFHMEIITDVEKIDFVIIATTN